MSTSCLLLIRTTELNGLAIWFEEWKFWIKTGVLWAYYFYHPLSVCHPGVYLNHLIKVCLSPTGLLSYYLDILLFYYFPISRLLFLFFTIVPWGSMFDNEKAEPVNFPQQTCIYEQQVGQEELLSWTSGHPCRWWPMLGHPFWGSDPCPRWSLALCRMRPISHQFQIEMSSNLQQGVMHAMMQA